MKHTHAEGPGSILKSRFARGVFPLVAALFACATAQADLLLYDGQYSPEEYKARRGFGHSTGEKGVELMKRCGARRLLLVHHDPGCTDRELLIREARIGRADVRFAREGEVIEL